MHGFISGQNLSLIPVIYCHYTKHRLKQKLISQLINFKKSVLKIARAIILMTIKFQDFDCESILLDKKSYGNISVYDISYKILIGAKPLRIRFDKIDEFIRVYDRTRHLVLFGLVKYDAICNRIRYLISLKVISQLWESRSWFLWFCGSRKHFDLTKFYNTR